MEYQQNYDYSHQSSQDIDWHYKEHLYEIVDTLEPLAWDIEIIFVQSSYFNTKERVSKRGKKIPSTVAERVVITFKVLNGKYKDSWYKVQLWGARKLDTGAWGRNPPELQEFLEIATHINPHCLDDKREQTNKWGNRQALYPLLSGMRLKLLIATLGIDDKGYRQDKFKFFAPDKTSGAEFILGKEEKPENRDYALFGKELKAEYDAYLDSYQNNNVPAQEAQPYGQEQPQTYTQEPENETEQETENGADDLPF